MKTLKNYLIITLMILMTYCVNSQSKVSLTFMQDSRLLILGDNKGNNAGTLNILSQFKMQGDQQEYGYMVVFPEYEIANLKGGKYERVSVNVGYVFNKLILNNFEAGINGGYGWIIRDNFTFNSFSVSGNLNYKITDNFKLTSALQLAQRKDLEKPVFRASGFIGIEFNLN